MHEVLVNRLGDLRLPRKSVVRLTDRPDMTMIVYRGRKTTTQQEQQFSGWHLAGLQCPMDTFSSLSLKCPKHVYQLYVLRLLEGSFTLS